MRAVTDGFRQDVMYGLRSMLRTPITTGAAVLSLALGIGATTAMLGAIDVWVLRPLPLPDADRLVRVFMSNQNHATNTFSARDAVDWRDASRTVDLAAYVSSGASLASGERAERVGTLVGSVNLLGVLGLQPALGRGFLPEEERAGGPGVAMLSDAFWREAFGADPGVVGTSVALDGRAMTVVGVLPPEASYEEFRGDVWIPLEVRPDEPRERFSLWGLARLRAGVSLSQARAELDEVAGTVAQQDPKRTFPNALVVPFRDSIYGPEIAQGGSVVGSAVLFALLIACANIANLLLARGARRSGELALRGALGAGRARILRQLLTESALLALAGGVLSVGVARLSVEALRRYVLPLDMPGRAQVVLDLRFMAIGLLLTALATVLFGFLPALAGSRVDIRTQLQQAAGGALGGRRRLGRALVIGELALAVILLVSTGLITRTLGALRSVDLGVRTEGLVAFRVSPPAADYPTGDEVAAFHARLRERIASIPGVATVSTSDQRPVGGFSTGLYAIAGADDPADDAPRRSANVRWAAASYRDLLDIQLVAGAWFDARADAPDGVPVAVVSRSFAARHWPSPEGALGARLVLDDLPWTIVGVVEDMRVWGPGSEPPAVIFRPIGQSTSRARVYVVDARTDPGSLIAAARSEVRALDPNVALYSAESVDDEVQERLRPQIAVRRIVGTVGVLAIVLTLVGVYGVTAHNVSLRTREMGLRLAVGADPRGVLGLILAEAARLAGWSLLIGLGLSLPVGRALAWAVMLTSPFDPWVLGVVGAIVGGAAVLASFGPAVRASRVDPVTALKAT